MPDTNMQFDKNVLNFINSLTVISSSIVMEKEGDSIVMRRSNGGQSLTYVMTTDKKNFEFTGDSIGFLTFSEFFNLLNCFQDPTIVQDENKLTIKKGNSRINYVLSDVEILNKMNNAGAKEIQFDNPDFSFVLTEADLKELDKMIGLLNAREDGQVEISSNGNDIKFSVYNSKSYDNSFEKVFTGMAYTDSEISYKIPTEILYSIPKGKYKISFKKEGVVQFSLVDNASILLDVYTANTNE